MKEKDDGWGIEWWWKERLVTVHFDDGVENWNGASGEASKGEAVRVGMELGEGRWRSWRREEEVRVSERGGRGWRHDEHGGGGG